MYNLCDFIFSRIDLEAGGHTPTPIFTQNGLNGVDSRTDVLFAVKIKTFQTSDPQAQKSAKIWHYWVGT